MKEVRVSWFEVSAFKGDPNYILWALASEKGFPTTGFTSLQPDWDKIDKCAYFEDVNSDEYVFQWTEKQTA